jgi:SNF2 family DNA or RNA helicase
MENILENNIGVTKCGHIYCYTCLKVTYERYKNCPVCKRGLEHGDIWKISYKDQITDQTEKIDTEFDKLISEVGTKLAHLIKYIKESKKHIIIFSQWHELLEKIGKVLDKHEIKNLFCKGNVYQKDKAIREFNENDTVKVIMLSSDSTAAGTNLTKASVVIFIDPIYGEYKVRKNQEKQAIGRAYRLGQKNIVEVVRFIIQDTIEEEIYNINVKEDKKMINVDNTLDEILIN